jgi:hypothetical protein
MLKIKKYVELDAKYVENRVIYVDFEGEYVGLKCKKGT